MQLTNFKKSIFLMTLILISSGCATSVKRGVVAMKISDTLAHVGIGENDVSAGDHVELYRNACSGSVKAEGTRTCHKESTGHGEVKEILNSDYSVVEFPAGTKFSEGDTIEKHSH